MKPCARCALAIDEFHRDTVGMTCTGTPWECRPAVLPPAGRLRRPAQQSEDFRLHDLWGDNPDRYPPDLETLVDGCECNSPRRAAGTSGDPDVNATEDRRKLSTKKKVYLRSIPIDPMTGEAEWDFRSCYDARRQRLLGRRKCFRCALEVERNGAEW